MRHTTNLQFATHAEIRRLIWHQEAHVRHFGPTNSKGIRKLWERNPRVAIARQAAMIITGHRKLLPVNQAKLDKSGETIGVLTIGLTMSPAHELAMFLRGHHACPGATAGCIAACVGNATGQAAISARSEFDGHRLARMARGLLRVVLRKQFKRVERKELAAAQRKAEREELEMVAYRPDVATDYQDNCDDLDVDLVYGYTAVSSAMRKDDRTYRAFSRKETERSDQLARQWVDRGYPVAVVFAVAKGQPMPATWNGAPVIDGDLHDVWPMQTHPTTGQPIKDSYGQHGVVVGLRYKYATNEQRDGIVSSGFAVAA